MKVITGTAVFSLIIGALGLLLSVSSFYIGQKSGAKEKGERDGTILTEIGYIKKGNDDIRAKLEVMQKSQHEAEVTNEIRFTKIEQSLERAHERLDEQGRTIRSAGATS